jgi:hypothetical protein
VEQPQISYYKDDHSGEIRDYNGVFEGPEKTLGEFMSVWLGGDAFRVECTSCVNKSANRVLTIIISSLPYNRGCLSQNLRIQRQPNRR